jgi:hypothetical protein
MSSSAAAGPKSLVSAVAAAGTYWLPPPSSPSPRPPRNWTLSATISTASRFEPSCACHSRQSRRPSIATGLPFERYCEQLSAWLPKTEMLK